MNRKKIVDKHSPVMTKIEPRAPLSIGNGEFGMSVDFTGLQTFPEQYVTPLSTQSNWGWHATGGKGSYTLDDVNVQYYQGVPYPLFPENKEEAYHWLRQNPHRLQLGQIGFLFEDTTAEEVKPVRQRHNLWSGVIESDFILNGEKVKVRTACASEEDVIGVSVTSNLLKKGQIAIQLAFPSPNMIDQKWEDTSALNWEEDGHQTEAFKQTNQSIKLNRIMDDTSYKVSWNWNTGEVRQTEAHKWVLTSDAEILTFTLSFSENKVIEKKAEEIFSESSEHWEKFWSNGGFLSFEGSKDPRADELERRVILSQYLLAVHSGGSVPPQETGYMYNSWFGKFHLEMHYWHAAHFPLWGRTAILHKSMNWYLNILPKAYQLAEYQGFQGARWPKMVGLEGEQTPSPIAPGLIWQQPHPICLAELCYQADKEEKVLESLSEVVFASADFMASFATYDEEQDVYQLGPGLIPAQENHRMEDSINPPYELEYWHFGLGIAIEWCERLGKNIPKKWKDVREKIAKPRVSDGLYLAHRDCENTFTEKNHDHPSMVAAVGVLPGELMDKKVMLDTLHKVKEEWQWETAWGWDFPMCAMTATRLGELDLAIDFLLMDQVKNTFSVNGHNYQHDALTVYLPGNGALLIAVAMLATKTGFPEGWAIEQEGLKDIYR
ncbi:glycoside hydrolase family 65 [Gracilibacillus suaedae]|uniref:glycoside hydrolase family 65 n=1 Tax=Gracilibacillus suaedae TaxID=2820273 RepID=UPI001ABE1CD7|nr:glycoside hydrolase family 65 [Gracilibacillus suaedae]